MMQRKTLFRGLSVLDPAGPNSASSVEAARVHIAARCFPSLDACSRAGPHWHVRTVRLGMHICIVV